MTHPDLQQNRPHFRIEKVRRWGSVSVRIVNRRAGEARCRNHYHVLTYFMTDFEASMNGDERPEWACELPRGTFAFRPAGTTLRSNLTSGQYIQILQSRETYTNLASDLVPGGLVRLTPRYALSDPLVSQIVLAFAREIEGGIFTHVLADALNTALAVQITRLCGDMTTITLAPPSGLSRERLKRVYHYVEEHLASRLTLTDLAAATGLSTYHFSRSFKQAVGIGPWRYVMQRRLQRAKALMLQTRQPLALIANEVGFADQSHLITVFRQETGITPGRFRDANDSGLRHSRPRLQNMPIEQIADLHLTPAGSVPKLDC